MQGYKEPKAYIVAESPMDNTCRIFWRMIEEQNCGIIVMLSDFREDEKVGDECSDLQTYLIGSATDQSAWEFIRI